MAKGNWKRITTVYLCTYFYKIVNSEVDELSAIGLL